MLRPVKPIAEGQPSEHQQQQADADQVPSRQRGFWNWLRRRPRPDSPSVEALEPDGSPEVVRIGHLRAPQPEQLPPEQPRTPPAQVPRLPDPAPAPTPLRRPPAPEGRPRSLTLRRASPSVDIGKPFPLGATVTAQGINFALFSRHATAVYLELFAAPDDNMPRWSVGLNPQTNRTGDVWHIFVRGCRAGQLYGFRADGPYSPEPDGHRFNVNKLLMDPYGRGYGGPFRFDNDAVHGYDRSSAEGDLSFSTVDSAPHVAKTVALATDTFDWRGDRLPQIPLADTVVHELHVKGFTAHPSAAIAAPGTYLGLLDKIGHLRQLGVTTVELLPIHEFNPKDVYASNPETGESLSNYWGYATLGFNAPFRGYASCMDAQVAANEFKEMVRRMHREGIEVVLDVVYNHTGEGDERGPTVGFRGLDNSIYYMLTEDGRHYMNYSGCGNTINCSHPVVRQLILESLRYWALEMHVDGFRFDLAPILGRGPEGQWLGGSGLLRDIAEDPILRTRKLIAEPWDAAGLYTLGKLPRGWAEWNGRYRDDVRRFVRGDRGRVGDLARRIGGSADLFPDNRGSSASINFVTAHDGFTLRDLVSHQEKHNLANGEDNRDGCWDNHSENCGVEGETDDDSVRALRRRLAKNLLTVLMVSRGTPMMLGGDELWRTQQGNNNAYCQDNEISWVDWGDTADAQEIERFTRLLVAMRKRHPALRRALAVDPFAEDDEPGDITWHGVHLEKPDWSFHSHSLALLIHGRSPEGAPDTDDLDIYVALNGWTEPLDFTLPQMDGDSQWYRLVDTALESPHDIVEPRNAKLVGGHSYLVHARTAAVFIAWPPAGSAQL